MNEIEKMRIDVFESVTWKELDDGAIALDIDSTTDHLRSKGYRKQEWISVEDRLPKQWQTVLVFCDDIISTDFIDSSGRWYEHIDHDAVTHWMPLPEPPKGGAE